LIKETGKLQYIIENKSKSISDLLLSLQGI